MGRQGCALGEQEITKIVKLLASTDMSIPEIAQRIGCSRSAVGSINRKHQVRNYGGNRGSWILTTETPGGVEASS